MNRIRGLMLLLAFMFLSLLACQAETIDQWDALKDADIHKALLSKNYPALADLTCNMLGASQNERGMLLALSALSVACEGLNRSQLTATMAQFERVSQMHSPTPFSGIALNDFRITQYSRLEDDIKTMECVRRSGRVNRLWALPPVIIFTDRNDERLTPCEAVPSVFGNRLSPVTVINGVFSPFSAAVRDRLKSNCHIPVGFAFSLQEDINDFWMNLATESRSLLYFDNWPFMMKDGKSHLLQPTLYTKATDGIAPVSANNCIQVSNLKAGTHTVFLLIPAESVSSVFISLLDGAGRPLSLEILEPQQEKITPDDLVNEKSTLTAQSRLLSQYDDLDLFFPKDNCSLDDLSKKHSQNLIIDDLKSLLIVHKLISLRSPAPHEFLKLAARQYNSPLVADWLAATRLDGWRKYDEDILKEHPSHSTGWIRTMLDTTDDEVAQFEMLLKRGSEIGFSPAILKELVLRIKKTEDFQAVATELVKWPFMPNLLAEMATNISVPAESRLDICRLLSKRTLFPLPHLETQVTLSVQQDNIDSAIAITNQLCRDFHWVAHFWAISGELHLKSGDRLMCIKAWQYALSLDPDYPHLRTLLQALQDEATGVPDEAVSAEEITALCEGARGIEAKEGIVQLTKRFNLTLSDRGVLSGSVIRIFMVTVSKKKLAIPVAIKEWADFTVIQGKSSCTIRRISGKTESLPVSSQLIGVSAAEQGDIVILNMHVERSNWAAYEPYAFDFIPVVTVGVPLIEYRYFLKCNSDSLSSWCSEDMHIKKQNNGILFFNEYPLVYNSLPCSPLPSIGWTTLTNREFSQRIEIEFKSKASVLPAIKEFDAQAKDKRETAVSLFNCLRDIIWVKRAPISILLSPSSATNAFDNKEATPFEFAIIYAAFAEQYGFADKLRFFMLAEESAFPWAIPKAEDGFFCPMLASSFCALFQDQGDPLFIRFSSPFYIKVTVSHHFKRGFALSLRDEEPKFTVFHGFQRQNSMSYSMEVKPDKEAILSIVALQIAFAGDAGEGLFAHASKGTSLGRRNLLLYSLVGFLQRCAPGINAHPRIPNVITQYGSEVLLNAPFTRFYRSTEDDAKRIRIIPTDFDLSGIISKNGKFTPAWTGNLTVNLKYHSSWELTLADKYFDYRAETSSIKLHTNIARDADTTTLIIQISIPESLNDLAELERYLEIAKDAEEALAAEVIWK